MNGTDMMTMLVDVAVPVATAIAGYFTGRRKRNNDFLSEMQGSIDMLSQKNREQMDEMIKLRGELVTVRTEYLELTKAQERLLAENRQLRSDIERLRADNAKQARLINQLKTQVSEIGQSQDSQE